MLAIFLLLTALHYMMPGPMPEVSRFGYVAFSDKGHFYILDKDSIHSSRDGSYWTLKKHRFSLSTYDLVAHKKEDTTYLIARGGGLVHQFRNDSVIRVDRSFDWKSRFQAHTFNRQGHILLFSGTGLFASKNNFIYYDEQQGEWFEYYARNKEFIEPLHNPIGFYNEETDQYIFTLGRRKRFNDAVYIEYNTAIYNFDFKTRSWEKAGKIPKEVVLKDYYNIIPNYPKPLIFHPNGLLRFDFQKAEIVDYTHTDNLKYLEGAKQIVYNEVLGSFLIMRSISVDMDQPLVISEAELLGNFSKTMAMEMGTDIPQWPYFFGLALVLLVPIFIYYNKKQRNILKNLDSIWTDLKDILSEEDFQLLQTIRDHHPEPISFPELMDHFGLALSYESRIKKLSKSLQIVDETLKSALGNKKSVLLISRSKTDKRIKQVQIK